MRLILILIIFLFFNINQSQDLDYGNKSEAARFCTDYQSKGFVPDYNAQEALDKILSVVGLAPRFMLYPCADISNALAWVSDSGKRYIIYDEQFMNSISEGNNYWGNMTILAHEVGHHVNGHMLSPDSSLSESRIEELEADQFAGFVLAKLGAELEDVESVFYEISFEGDDTESTHPSRSRRINSVRKGYQEAISGIGFNQKDLETDEEYFYRAYDHFNNGDYEKAISDYTESIKLNPIKESYFNRGLAKEAIDDYAGASIDMQRALELDPNYLSAIDQLAFYYYKKGDNYLSIHYSKLALDDGGLTKDDIFNNNIFLAESFNRVGFYSESIKHALQAFEEKPIDEITYPSVSELGNTIGAYKFIYDSYASMDSLSKAEIYINKLLDITTNQKYKSSELAKLITAKNIFYSVALFEARFKNNHLKAIQYFQMSIDEDRSRELSHFYKSRSYEKLAINEQDTNKQREYFFGAYYAISDALALNEDGYNLNNKGWYAYKLGLDGYCDDWLKAYSNYGYGLAKTNLIRTCSYDEEYFYNNEDYYTAGKDSYDKENYEDAIESFSKGIDLALKSQNPEEMDIYLDFYYRGMSYYYLEENEKALTDLLKAREYGADFTTLYIDLAKTYFRLTAYNKALGELLNQKETVEQYDDDDLEEYDYVFNDFYDIYIGVLLKTSQADEAEKSLDFLVRTFERVENDYYLDMSLYNRARYYYDNGNLSSAIADLNRAITINSDYANLSLLAQYKEEIGDKRGACNEYNKALKVEGIAEQTKNTVLKKLKDLDCL